MPADAAREGEALTLVLGHFCRPGHTPARFRAGGSVGPAPASRTKPTPQAPHPLPSGPGGSRTHTPLSGKRILSPLRLPIPPRAQGPDSTGDAAILEAVRERDWGRLGGLLGAQDQELGELVSRWPSLPPMQREAVLRLVQTLGTRSEPSGLLPFSEPPRERQASEHRGR